MGLTKVMCADRTFDLPFQKPGSSASSRRSSELRPSRANKRKRRKTGLLICFAQGERNSIAIGLPACRLGSTTRASYITN